MFNILSMCDDYILGNILGIVKKTITVLGIIVPILLIIGASINIAKAVLNPEDKKVIKKVANQFISAIVIFLLPFAINTTMKIISIAGTDSTPIGITENGTTKNFSISECWNGIKTVDITPKFNSVSYEKANSIASEQNNNKGSSGSSGSTGTNNNKTKSNTSGTNNSTLNNTTTNQKFRKVVIVGDSRFVWLKDNNTNGSKIVYIAEGSKGLSYLKEQIGVVKSHDAKDVAFVINLGVNDLYLNNITNQYITYINNMANTMKGKIYYMSVNPVIENMAKTNGYNTGWVNNANINKFNSTLKSGFNNKITYLDSNAYLKAQGFGPKDTFDGIHYYGPTYEKIRDYILTQLKMK